MSRPSAGLRCGCGRLPSHPVRKHSGHLLPSSTTVSEHQVRNCRYGLTWCLCNVLFPCFQPHTATQNLQTPQCSCNPPHAHIPRACPQSAVARCRHLVPPERLERGGWNCQCAWLGKSSMPGAARAAAATHLLTPVLFRPFCLAHAALAVPCKLEVPAIGTVPITGLWSLVATAAAATSTSTT